MKLFRTIQLGLLQRRILNTLSGVEAQLREQNALLRRLADHFAPEIPTAPSDLAVQTSVSFLNLEEKGKVLDYIEKTVIDTGRAPTEDEIMQYLSDEATQALHTQQEGQTL